MDGKTLGTYSPTPTKLHGGPTTVRMVEAKDGGIYGVWKTWALPSGKQHTPISGPFRTLEGALNHAMASMV